jgi:uncharacterized lipoprotein YbaY
MVRVTGAVRLPPADGAYAIARVRVSVRDVTEADGPAPTVASVELPAVQVPAAGMDLPFTLDVPVDPRRTYTVRAHGDRDGSGSVESGDFVSTVAQVINPAVPPSHLVVPLQPVGG